MKKKEYDILTFGSITLDIFLLPEDKDVQILERGKVDFFCFPIGEKIKVGEVIRAPGGGAANTSIGFAKMGLKTAIFGALGDDEEAHLIKKKLQKFKIDTSFLTRERDAYSNLSIIFMAPDGKRTVFHSRQTNTKVCPHSLRNVPRTKAIYVSHLYGAAEKLLFEIPEWKKRTGGLVAWNPGKTQFEKGFSAFKKVFPCIDLLILNTEEAERFTGLKARKVSLPLPQKKREGKLGKKVTVGSEFRTNEVYDVRALADKFLHAGVLNVVITDGAQGVQLFSKEGIHFWCPSPNIKVKSTLGAGDAFSVGVVTAFLRGELPENQVKWGTLNAASVIQKFGAQEGLMTEKQITRLRDDKTTRK